MTEVDEIEAALTGPVNNWLNNNQLLKFQRLVQIARRVEQLGVRVNRLTAAQAALCGLVELTKPVEHGD